MKLSCPIGLLRRMDYEKTTVIEAGCTDEAVRETEAQVSGDKNPLQMLRRANPTY